MTTQIILQDSNGNYDVYNCLGDVGETGNMDGVHYAFTNTGDPDDYPVVLEFVETVTELPSGAEPINETQCYGPDYWATWQIRSL